MGQVSIGHSAFLQLLAMNAFFKHVSIQPKNGGSPTLQQTTFKLSFSFRDWERGRGTLTLNAMSLREKELNLYT